MSRSALSSMVNQQQNDNTPIAKRYIKGIFENNQELDIQKLTHRLFMLMALISGSQRVQIIHNLRVSDILFVILVMSVIKQTNPTKHVVPLCFETYNKQSKLFVVRHLTECLKRIKCNRDTDKLLF